MSEAATTSSSSTTRRQRAPAAIAAAFCLAAALGATTYNHFHELSNTLFDENSTPRRRLGASIIMDPTRPGIVNRRYRDRLNDLSICRGVLVSSQGGVGSSAFLKPLLEAQEEGHMSQYFTNDQSDHDGLKHLPATAFRHDPSSLHPLSHRYSDSVCFGKALVIIGDPVHTIESTYRRFKLVHINKLRKNLLALPKFPEGFELENVYRDLVETGIDTTGLSLYIESWVKASRDPKYWPDIRVVTARTLYNNAVDHAAWMGVEEGGLHHFAELAFDESKALDRTQPTVDGVQVKGEMVWNIFAPVAELVRQINDGQII